MMRPTRWMVGLGVALGLALGGAAGAAPGEPELLAQRGKGPRVKGRSGGSALDKAVERRFQATARTLRQARAKVQRTGHGRAVLRKAVVAQFAARRALAAGNRSLARRLTGKAQRLARRAMAQARPGRAPGKALGAVKTKGSAAAEAMPTPSREEDGVRAAAPPAAAPLPEASEGAGGGAKAEAPKKDVARRARPAAQPADAISGDDEEAIAGDDEEAIAGDDEEAIAGDDEESIAGDDEEAIAAVKAAEAEVPGEDALVDDDAAFEALDRPAGR